MGQAKLHVVPAAGVAEETNGPASKRTRKSRSKPEFSRVSELMHREVAHCRPYETLNTVGRLMWDRDVGVIVIVDEQTRPLSVVTDRDVAMAAYTQGANLSNISIRSCMAQHLVTCFADATALDAMRLMQENRVRRLPVVDNSGKLVGIIGFADLIRASINKKLKTGIKTADLASAHAAVLGC